MVPNTTDIENDLVARTGSTIREAIRKAYQRGYVDGGNAMRENILKAAGAPMPVATTNLDALVETKRRAPKGLLQETLIKVLSKTPHGLSQKALEKEVLASEPLIAQRSIYGELNRKRGDLYDFRDGKWLLLAGKADDQGEAAGPPTKDDPPPYRSNQGGPNGTALAS